MRLTPLRSLSSPGIVVLLSMLAACAHRGSSVAPSIATANSTSTSTSIAASKNGPPKDGPPFVRFHVDFWANLNQVLLHEALLPRPRWEGPKSLKGQHVAPADTLEPPEVAQWREGLAYYDTHFTTGNLIGNFIGSERALLGIGASQTPSPTTGLDQEWQSRLVAAAPIYRAHFWPNHERRDLAYIEEMRPLIAAHAAWFAKRLVAVYGMPLPNQPIDVEITPAVPPYGGFTQGAPPYIPPHAPLITLSSEDPSYAGEAGVEMFFHEVSHLLVGRVQEGLEASAKRQGRKLEPRFWHDVIFYTAGHLTRERLGPAYVPYAERPSSRIFEETDPSLVILRRAWQPYLDGRVTMDAAIDAMAASFPN